MTVVVVRVNYLIDGTYQLWMDEPESDVPLGTIHDSRMLGTEAVRLAAERLEISNREVELQDLRISKPAWITEGQQILVKRDDSSWATAVVQGFVQGGILADTDQGSGIWPMENVRATSV